MQWTQTWGHRHSEFRQHLWGRPGPGMTSEVLRGTVCMPSNYCSSPPPLITLLLLSLDDSNYCYYALGTVQSSSYDYLIFMAILWGQTYYPCFTDETIEISKGSVTCPIAELVHVEAGIWTQFESMILTTTLCPLRYPGFMMLLSPLRLNASPIG